MFKRFQFLFPLALIASAILVPSLIMAETPLPPDPFPIEHFPPPPDIETGAFFYQFMKMLVILGVMIGALLAITWYMRRLTGTQVVKGNEESYIKIIDKRNLSPRTVIYLLEIEGKSIVVGETPHGLVRLKDEN